MRVEETDEDSVSLPRGAIRLLAVVAGIAFVFALLRPFFAFVGHDQAWGLYMATQWLHGVQIDGDQLVELNPPFIVWFMALPVFLGRLLHISSLNACRLFFDLLFAGVTAWSLALVRKLYPGDRALRWVVLLAMTVGFMLVVPRDDVGERDQFTALMLVPYVLYGLYRLRGVRLHVAHVIAIGALGGVAACLKPQYVLLPMALEVVLIARKQMRRLSSALLAPAALAAVVLVYTAIVAVAYRAYLTSIAPAIRMAYYYDHLMGLGLHWVKWGLFFLVGTLLVLGAARVLRRTLPHRALGVMFLVASLMSLAVYRLQGKGMRYQAAPIAAFGAVALGVLLLDLFARHVQDEGPDRYRRMMFVGAALVSAVVLPRVMHYEDLAPTHEAATAARIFGRYPAGTAVGLISYGPWEFPAVMEQNKVWASRFMHTWWLPVLLVKESSKGPDAARAREYTMLFRHQYGEDLQRWKPAVIVYEQYSPEVEAAAHAEGLASVLDWMQQDALFRSEWSRYALQDTENGLQVYVRRP